MRIWSCKIGEVDAARLPPGSDALMRDAIAAAYRVITGEDPKFIFSGWAAELTDSERAVVDDKPPPGIPCSRCGNSTRADGRCMQCYPSLEMVPISDYDDEPYGGGV